MCECIQVLRLGEGADLVIEIPGSGGAGGGQYRLDYRPPDGLPAPNYTVAARASTINFTGLPGTHYHFMLYYSNDTFADLLTWNQTIVTGNLLTPLTHHTLVRHLLRMQCAAGTRYCYSIILAQVSLSSET